MKRYLILLLLLFAVPVVAGQPVIVIGLDRIDIPADGDGVCTVTGYLLPGTDAAVLCTLDHAERSPLIAQVETGSLDVQGWVLRTTGGSALVALRNPTDRPIGLFSTRVVLGRAAPVSPVMAPGAERERCMVQAIRDRQDPWFCWLYRNAQTEAPAAATAGAE